MPEEIHTTIREIESDAEKLLQEARAKARQVLEGAKKKGEQNIVFRAPYG